ncbi:MAG TPA: two-component regulator propeller domain-containing protein [bacterium]|nr:two-component regulator propeller domain-containing protein [bacterium]HMY35950.1 two-component regulator propeller domain-containing protein [bacterium]HNE82803.1 two-component regulator propeller domain-containing protein [bacterium]HNF85040.1 two-component regulator propeller domain-containing protein [bacterium]HNH31384.1 two-component regulator propeller domain-containing protein [bacterium]
MIKKRILVAWLFFIGTTFLFSQSREFEFKRLTVENGLSQSNVYAIVQDYRGFIWFGTQDGLNRYDGYQFSVFKHDIDDSNSISMNWINTIYEDKHRVLWVGTQGGGLSRMNQTTEHFRNFTADGQAGSLPSNDVYAILEDHIGNFMIATGRGIVYMDREKETFRPASEIPELKYGQIRALCVERSGTVWAGTQLGGLFVRDRQGQWFRISMQVAGRPQSDELAVSSITEDVTGQVWIGTDKGLFNWDNGTMSKYTSPKLENKVLTDGPINHVSTDRAGRVWIGTDNFGLFGIFDTTRSEAVRFINDQLNPRSLSENRVYSTLEDDAGNVWIGTGGGVSIWNARANKFRVYRRSPTSQNTLSHNHVWDILEDRMGFLWVGTNDGLNRLDRKTGNWKNWRYNKTHASGLSAERVWTIYETRDGEIWLGMSGGGLSRYDAATDRFIHFLHDQKNPASINNNRVRSIAEDHDGILWVATRGGGLNRLDRKKNVFTSYQYDGPDGKGISSNDTYVLLVQDSVLWIGTFDNGLNSLNLRTMTFTRYTHDPRNPSSISSNKISSLCLDRNGALWIGTTEGLNRLNHQRNSFERYTPKDGLPNEVILGVLEDNKGFLWLSTNRGLARFDPLAPRGQKFRNYNPNDGLQADEFNGSSFHKSKSGELFFGGVNGFNAFFPEEIKDNTHVPSVVLTAFKIFDKPFRLQGAIAAMDQVTLGQKENAFSFEFAALDFTAPTKNQYAYKMEGFDEDWIYCGTRRYAGYTNLDGGTYTFRVKASNNDGIWNNEGIAVQVTVVPVFYKTVWFRILASLVIVLVAYSFYRSRLNRVNRIKELLERKVAERTKDLSEMNAKIMETDRLKSEFLANMSHELRTPLNAIIGFSELLIDEMRHSANADQLQNLSDIHDSGRHLLMLINDILDLSKIEAGKMELFPQQFIMEELLESVHHTMAPLLNRKNQTLSWQLDTNAPAVYADQNKIKQVLINLLSNAIKFSPHDSAIIVTSKALNTDENDMVEIAVHDHGKGIAPENLDLIFEEFRQIDGSHARAEQGTGLGLALCRRLIEMHGGKISVESEIHHGSTFRFTIPRAVAGSSQEVMSETPVDLTHQSLILMIEDDPQSANLLRRYLEIAGYRVAHVRNGSEALEEARRLKPMAITLDIMLPGKDGWQILQELKNDADTSDIPVFIVSVAENKELAYSLKAEDYFTKPIDRERLIHRIGQLRMRRITGEIRQILIVDDDPNALSILESFLYKNGFRVLRAHGGREALVMMHGATIDLVLLDLMMPGMSGFEVVEAMRNEEKLREIPIIILTAKDLTAEERERLRMHVRALMQKATYTTEDLIEEIRRIHPKTGALSNS